jgi:hypothetical protein
MPGLNLVNHLLSMWNAFSQRLDLRALVFRIYRPGQRHDSIFHRMMNATPKSTRNQRRIQIIVDTFVDIRINRFRIARIARRND